MNGNGSTGSQAHGIEDQTHGNNGNGTGTQEAYFSTTSLGRVCVRGLKKLVTEVTSIKTLAMAAVVGLIYFQKLDSVSGIIGILGLTGAREIDFNQVINIFQSRFSGGGPR